MPPRPPVVAVFNTSEDTTDLLRLVLERAGLVVVAAFTNEIRDSKVDLVNFVHEHQPDAILYDVALPYESNWALFEHIRSRPICRGIPFVLTTTNLAQVTRLTKDAGDAVHEIVGKPYDLDRVVDAVREALKAAGRTGRAEA